MINIKVSSFRNHVDVRFNEASGIDLSYSQAMDLYKQLHEVYLQHSNVEQVGILTQEIEAGDYLWGMKVESVHSYPAPPSHTRVEFEIGHTARLLHNRSITVERQIQ